MPAYAAIKPDDVPSADTTPASADTPGVDSTHLVGAWVNTCRETRSLLRFTLARSDSGYVIETLAANAAGGHSLGRATLRPFSADVDSRQADGFTAHYDFEFLEMSLVAYCVKGLIVVSQYTRFKDGSGRPDYFNREFFFKEES